jgi:hypothetical protein
MSAELKTTGTKKPVDHGNLVMSMNAPLFSPTKAG